MDPPIFVIKVYVSFVTWYLNLGIIHLNKTIIQPPATLQPVFTLLNMHCNNCCKLGGTLWWHHPRVIQY
jgi:hypothetical protein